MPPKPDFSNPDFEDDREDPYYERVSASEMKDCCTFRSGSLYCVNYPCPNKNHRQRTDVCTEEEDTNG